MKKIPACLIPVLFGFLLLYSCREGGKDQKISPSPVQKEFKSDGLIKIGTDIITEIIIKPDPDGDPWELEKLKGFNGEPMFLDLINKINRNAIKIYDCITGKELNSREARNLLKETGSDIYKIGKIQFTEDWYFNPETNEITKKVKSISFGYESKRGEGLPPAYLPYFQINTE